MSEAADYPVVRARVNEHLQRIVQKSTYRFNLSGVIDNASAIVDAPTAFEYEGEGGSAFRLAPTGFVALSQSAGWVYDITVALPDASKPLAEAYAVAGTVDRVLTDTKWRRVAGPLPSLDVIQRDLANPVTGSSGNHGLGQWRFGDSQLSVTLKRTAERGERTSMLDQRLDADLYAVEVNVSDGTRVSAYDARLLAIRRARQHGDASRALPLNAILDDPTPVTNGIPSRTPQR